MNDYQAVILAVAHDEFEVLDLSINPKCVIYDVKGVLRESDGAL
jgi:UDP-N-acetyl-D-galactosamine dehydrogenase